MQLPVQEWSNEAHLEALYKEFAAKTTGQHSLGLQRLINWLRSDAMEGKLALLCTVPHREWVLIQMNGRGHPITRLDEVFHDIDDAERAIFRRRVQMRLGYTIRGE
jgi:hypothetical protein